MRDSAGGPVQGAAAVRGNQGTIDEVCVKEAKGTACHGFR